MDISKQVTNWVEKKFGNLITNELKDKIQEENSSFDVESYVNDLLDKYFKENEVECLKKEIFDDCINFNINYESDSSAEVENYFHDSLEYEQNEFHSMSTEEIIKNLQNNCEEVRIKSLNALETSAEDLVNQTSWIVIKKILQNLLETKGDKKSYILVLKVIRREKRCLRGPRIKDLNLDLKIFNKLLTCQKPQTVCEGFISLSEVISYHIEMVNSEDGHVSFEEIYDLKERKWLYIKSLPETGRSLNDHFPNHQRTIDAEVLIKSMWLLTESQKQMPEKWLRFSEKKLREIIFSFIHLLSSTTVSENEKLTGLELLSILNPTATWCRHWCHTAVGRSLLCSALRKYKNFFIHAVEIILINMRLKRVHQLQSINGDGNSNEMSPRTGNEISKPLVQTDTDKHQKIEKENKYLKGKSLEKERSKYVRSAPTLNKRASMLRGKMRKEESSECAIGNIPRRVVTQALFCHCMSLVVCLIQYRSGRSLFPVQTASKRRLLTAQDLILSMIDYLENFEHIEGIIKGVTFTPAYKRQILEMLKILKDVRNNIHSSRRSADRLQLSQR